MLTPNLPRNPTEIMQWLPHRAPMLLLDAVTHCDADSLVANRHFSAQELFFQGHFPPPDMPILPGVIIVEALAQAAAIHTSLVKNLRQGQVQYRFSKAADIVWLGPVKPGDTLRLQIKKTREKLGFYQFVGQAEVMGGASVCTAHFTAKVIVL